MGPSSGRMLGAGCALVLVCALASAETGAVKQTSASKKPAAHRPTSHSASHKSKKSRRTAGNWRRHGQQKIDPQRAREIQEALIHEHYLTGKASGVWDDASQKAMEKYQADNGWQSKTVPDARALIKMGLGPDREHLLNPESAMTTQPQPTPASPTSAPATTPDSASANQPQK